MHTVPFYYQEIIVLIYDHHRSYFSIENPANKNNIYDQIIIVPTNNDHHIAACGGLEERSFSRYFAPDTLQWL